MFERYLFEGEETIKDAYKRVAFSLGSNLLQKQRLYKYMCCGWFMPSTPILSNAGTQRGLPISCFVNAVQDTINDISATYYENVHLASQGGGIGTDWSNIREIGAAIDNRGSTSGVVPFIKVQDSLTLAISQGSLRRGSSAAYMHVSHPEIEEFIAMRKHTGGDVNRKTLNLHQGVAINDKFMHAVEEGTTFDLISPHTGLTASTINARDLWARILTTRIETGEPYILFTGNANRHLPPTYQKNRLFVSTSNLCSEIMLHTEKDYNNRKRTAVCCLASVNLEHFDEWHNNKHFITDILSMLDNALSRFTENAPPALKNACYSARHERSVGLGVMGFHSYLQQNNIAFDSTKSRILNINIFNYIRSKADQASAALAKERGACPDATRFRIAERFSHKLAIAPTASISRILDTSPSTDPYISNAYTVKTLSGSHPMKNKNLIRLLKRKKMNTDEVWQSIVVNEGSVQHLNFFNDNEKLVYRTAFEIPQEAIIDLAADRTPYICQGQSINLFLPADINKKVLHKLHFDAWKKGLKSLYYVRSRSLQRAETVSKINDFECTGCQ